MLQAFTELLDETKYPCLHKNTCHCVWSQLVLVTKYDILCLTLYDGGRMIVIKGRITIIHF